MTVVFFLNVFSYKELRGTDVMKVVLALVSYDNFFSLNVFSYKELRGTDVMKMVLACILIHNFFLESAYDAQIRN